MVHILMCVHAFESLVQIGKRLEGTRGKLDSSMSGPFVGGLLTANTNTHSTPIRLRMLGSALVMKLIDACRERIFSRKSNLHFLVANDEGELTVEGTGSTKNMGKEDPFELNSSQTL
jgi:hypothetical protein